MGMVLLLLAQDKVQIEIKVEPGFKAQVEYAYTSSGKMKIKSEDVPQPSDSAEANWTETALEVKDGAVVKIEQVYHKHRVGRGRDMTATSLEGHKIIMTDTGGRRCEIEAEGVKPEDLKDIGLRAEALRRSLPKEPVTVNASWEVDEKEALADANDQDLGVQFSHAALKCTFEGIEEKEGQRCAVVRMAGETRGTWTDGSVSTNKIVNRYYISLEKKFVVVAETSGTYEISGENFTGSGRFESVAKSALMAR
jgi:hypothetical protein